MPAESILMPGFSPRECPFEISAPGSTHCPNLSGLRLCRVIVGRDCGTGPCHHPRNGFVTRSGDALTRGGHECRCPGMDFAGHSDGIGATSNLTGLISTALLELYGAGLPDMQRSGASPLPEMVFEDAGYFAGSGSPWAGTDSWEPISVLLSKRQIGPLLSDGCNGSF